MAKLLPTSLVIETSYDDPKWREKEDAELAKYEIVRFPWADGYALYAVVKENPLTLQHIKVGDGYQVPAFYIRGFSKADLAGHRARTKMIGKLFPGKPNARLGGIFAS